MGRCGQGEEKKRGRTDRRRLFPSSNRRLGRNARDPTSHRLHRAWIGGGVEALIGRAVLTPATQHAPDLAGFYSYTAV